MNILKRAEDQIFPARDTFAEQIPEPQGKRDLKGPFHNHYGKEEVVFVDGV